MVDAIFIDPAVFAFLLGKLDVMVGCHNKRLIPGDFVILTDDFIAGRTLLFVFHKDRGVKLAFSREFTGLVDRQAYVSNPGVRFEDHIRGGGDVRGRCRGRTQCPA